VSVDGGRDVGLGLVLLVGGVEDFVFVVLESLVSIVMPMVDRYFC